MADRVKLIRRRAPEPEDVEEDDDVIVEEEDEEPEPAPVKRTTRKIVAEPEDDDDEPAPVKKSSKPVIKKVIPPPAKKVVPPAPVKKVKQPEPEEDEAPAPKVVKVKSVADTVVDNILPKLLDSLVAGKAIIITKIGENKWQVLPSDAVAKSKKVVGKEYWDEVISEEYRQWSEEWSALTFAEKQQRGKKAGIKWNASGDQRIEIMSLTDAMRKHDGIEKYKEQYRDRAARALLRG